VTVSWQLVGVRNGPGKGLPLVPVLASNSWGQVGAAPQPALPTGPGSRAIGLFEPHRSADYDDPKSGEHMGMVYMEENKLLLYSLR
jgi:hypothetical protein